VALALTAASMVQASGFVLGCLAIHRVRVHAARITPFLILAAVILLSLVLSKLTLDWLPLDEAEMLAIYSL
jgi:hypothetical protein